MRRRIRSILLVLPVFLCAAQAQTPLTLSGVVIESGTGRPIPGAAVSVVGGKANQDVTDSQGKFSLTLTADVKPGAKVRIRVVKNGYGIWDNYIAASAEIAEPIWLKKLGKTSPHKLDEKDKPDKPSEKPSSPIVVQVPYGNLKKRCEDLGNAIVRFAEQRNQTKPDLGTHQQDYWDWYRINDGQFRFRFYDDAKALDKDLEAVNVKDRRLDELIARHESYFAERNKISTQIVVERTPMYHLSIEDIGEIGQRFKFLASQIPGAVDEEAFSVSVEWAKFSFGGKGFGTNFWIDYSSRNDCSISNIQAIYFIRIKNMRNVPVTVVGYSIDVGGVPLVRVQTGMGNIVGIPLNGTIFGAKVVNAIKEGDSIHIGQGPGFSMVQVPLDKSDFAHSWLLRMDLIDDLLKVPLQPNIPIRGWAFYQSPNENAFTVAGPGHITLETDDSRTFSYEFDLSNPHSEMDVLDRVITVNSFVDLSGCKRP
jgi:hypothetical protein